MDNATVERYLYDHIPLSRSMAVSVMQVDQKGVILSAPLSPNINHRSTAFGGSLSAIAILAAWTYIHCQLEALSLPCRLVIQSNSIEYLQPVAADFYAHCMAPPQQHWDRFIKTIARRGKGRITLSAEIYSETRLAGKFQGKYVALKL